MGRGNPVRAHAKWFVSRVEITLNTTRHELCPTASQCGTAADTKHEARVSCLRLSRHDTVHAQDFSGRHAKHGTITRHDYNPAHNLSFNGSSVAMVRKGLTFRRAELLQDPSEVVV